MTAATPTAALFLVGSVIGASGAWIFTHDGGPDTSPPITATRPAVQATELVPQVGAGGEDPLRGLEGLTAAVPGAAPGPALDALAERAHVDPASALARALAVPSTWLREIALDRVARAWAADDPQSAFEALAGITDADSRRAFGSALFTSLASVDPDATLARLFAVDDESAQLARDAISIIASRDPDAMMAALEKASDETRRDLLARALILSIAERDPIEATRMADTLPPSIATRFVYSDIARSYAARDPEGALAWAYALEDGASSQVMSAIFGTIAANDLGRAVELSLSNSGSQFDLGSLFFISTSSTGYSYAPNVVIDNLGQMPQIVERLTASDQARARAVVDGVLESWALADPDAAMDWLLARGSLVAPEQVAALAAGFSQNDVRLTAAAVDLLPPARRGQWITEVAAAYAATDADAALDWLSRYRGDPAYGNWVSTAAIRMAANSSFGFDPAPAVRLLSSTDAPDPAAVTQIVRRWAGEDPAAAGDWALGLSDPAAREAGAAATVAGWVNGDIDSASRWALGLSSGSVRDAALLPILTRTVTAGTVEPRIVAAFSDDATRDAALAEALPGLFALARRNPAQASAIARTYYGTPALRRRAQEIIDGAPPQ